MAIEHTKHKLTAQEGYICPSFATYLNNNSENNLKINKDDSCGWTVTKFIAQKVSCALAFSVGMVETVICGAVGIACGLAFSPLLLFTYKVQERIISPLLKGAQASASATIEAVAYFFSKNGAAPAPQVVVPQPLEPLAPAPLTLQSRAEKVKVFMQQKWTSLQTTATAHPITTAVVVVLALGLTYALVQRQLVPSSSGKDKIEEARDVAARLAEQAKGPIFGPITATEAFKKAENELQTVQKEVEQAFDASENAIEKLNTATRLAEQAKGPVFGPITATETLKEEVLKELESVQEAASKAYKEFDKAYDASVAANKTLVLKKTFVQTSETQSLMTAVDPEWAKKFAANLPLVKEQAKEAEKAAEAAYARFLKAEELADAWTEKLKVLWAKAEQLPD